jgi:hypothetical protein
VLEAVIARSAADLSEALETALRGAGAGLGPGRSRRALGLPLAARQPELLGLLREVSPAGPPGGDPDDAGARAPGAAGVIFLGG